MSPPAVLPLRAFPATRPGPKPRLGFLGLGWIGRLRLAALAESDCAAIAVLADPCAAALRAASEFAPAAEQAGGLEELLALDLDGVVIATPNALHAAQSIACLERGLAVFCQKPLARTAAETRRIIAAARAADRALAVDFSYRRMRGIAAIRRLIRSGALGTLYAMDLCFHNAFGPGQPWFHDLKQAGGGCVMDLGSHLVDLALWLADAKVRDIDSRLYRNGRLLAKPICELEDFAVIRLGFVGGATARVACSWNLAAGRDAVIEFAFYGTEGGCALRNLNGSFLDFVVERFHGTRREPLAAPPDAWGGRALEDWTRHLAGHGRYVEDGGHLAAVAEVLDGIYGRS